MKTVAAAAAFAGMASAMSWNDFPSFKTPTNNNNQCDTQEQSGFSWGDLGTGNFNSYGGFSFSGFSCSSNFAKRDALIKRGFNAKVIEGSMSAGQGPSLSCGSDKDFSITQYQVSVSKDTDVEFHYQMQDGTTCKHTTSCKSGGTVVQNSQCGGAQQVSFQLPQGSSGGCDIGIHSIGFDCSPPPSSAPPTSPSSTSSRPAIPPTSSSPAPPPPRVTTSSAAPPPPPVISSSSSSSASAAPPPPPVITSSSAAPPAPPPATTSSRPGQSVPPQSVPPQSVPPQSVPPQCQPGMYGNSSMPGCLPPSPPPASSAAPPPPPASSAAPPPPPASSAPFPPPPVSSTPPSPPSPPSSSGAPPPSPPSPPPASSGAPPPPPPASSSSTSAPPSPPQISSSSSTPPSPPQGPSSTPGSPVATSSRPSPPPPGPSAPCPDVLPQCLNTWIQQSGCKDNSDYTCFCGKADFTKNVINCVDSFGADSSTVQQALSYFLGICAAFIPQNPGLVTNCPKSIPLTPVMPAATPTPVTSGSPVESDTTTYTTAVVTQVLTTCPAGQTVTDNAGKETVLSTPSVSTITATSTVVLTTCAKCNGGGSPPATTAPPMYTTVTIASTYTVPCTYTDGVSWGMPIPGSSTVTQLTTAVTVPQVQFTTAAPVTGATATTTPQVGLAQGPPPTPYVPVGGGAAAPSSPAGAVPGMYTGIGTSFVPTQYNPTQTATGGPLQVTTNAAPKGNAGTIFGVIVGGAVAILAI